MKATMNSMITIIAAEIVLDQFGHHQADTGQCHGADDDARRGGRDADADHVARTGDEAVEQIVETAMHLGRRDCPACGKRHSADAG